MTPLQKISTKDLKLLRDNLDKIANTTERILGKVEQVIEILADSPQVITLIMVSIIVLVATVINLLIGMQNMKLAKALKFENKQNAEEILQKFTEKMTKAEKLIRGQPQEEEVPIPDKAPVQVPSPMLTVTVQGPGYARENWQERGIYLN